MQDDAGHCATAMALVLAEYHQATMDLQGALLRDDREAVDDAIEARNRCIRSYSSLMDAWLMFPERSRAVVRDATRVESMQWHLTCINLADDEILQFIQRRKNEAGDALARLGLSGRMERSYTSGPHERMQILSGEG